MNDIYAKIERCKEIHRSLVAKRDELENTIGDLNVAIAENDYALAELEGVLDD